MTFIISEDQFSLVLNKKTNIKHLKYEDKERRDWGRAPCKEIINESDSVKLNEPPRNVTCKKCLKIVTNNNKRAIFVSPDDYRDDTIDGTSEKQKLMTKKITEEYEIEQSSGSYIDEKVEFLNGSSIRLRAHDPAYGDCGDPYILFDFVDVSYGKTKTKSISFNPSSFNTVANALIYLISKIKMDIPMYEGGKSKNPNKNSYGSIFR